MGPRKFGLLIVNVGAKIHTGIVINTLNESATVYLVTVEGGMMGIQVTTYPDRTTKSNSENKANKRSRTLSNREKEVMELLTNGMDNKGIGSALGIKVVTVEKHLTNIYRKLGVNSRSAAIISWLKGRDFRN